MVTAGVLLFLHDQCVTFMNSVTTVGLVAQLLKKKASTHPFFLCGVNDWDFKRDIHTSKHN